MRLAFPTASDLGSLFVWAKRLVEDLNRLQSIDELQTASDDADAAAKNIRVGGAYVSTDGIVRRRVA
jgi:hypothetical protein